MANSLYLVGVDGSEPSQRAVEFAAKQAAKTGAAVLLANIVHWSGYTPLSVGEAMRRPLDKKEEERIATQEVLAPLKKAAEKHGVTVETHHTWGHPAQVLRSLANERQAEMVVVGRRGHSNLAELILGSVSNSIVHMSDVPVVVVP